MATSTDFDIAGFFKKLAESHAQGQDAGGGSNRVNNSSVQQLRLDQFVQGGSIFEGDREMNMGRQQRLAQNFVNRVRDAEEEQAEVMRNRNELSNEVPPA